MSRKGGGGFLGQIITIFFFHCFLRPHVHINGKQMCNANTLEHYHVHPSLSTTTLLPAATQRKGKKGKTDEER